MDSRPSPVRSPPPVEAPLSSKGVEDVLQEGNTRPCVLRECPVLVPMSKGVSLGSSRPFPFRLFLLPCEAGAFPRRPGSALESRVPTLPPVKVVRDPASVWVLSTVVVSVHPVARGWFDRGAPVPLSAPSVRLHVPGRPVNTRAEHPLTVSTLSSVCNQNGFFVGSAHRG